jgi:hypothetical protein
MLRVHWIRIVLIGLLVGFVILAIRLHVAADQALMHN